MSAHLAVRPLRPLATARDVLGVTYDPEWRTIAYEGRRNTLRRMSAKLFVTLADAVPGTMTYAEIAEAVWGRKMSLESLSQNVRVTIADVRAALASIGAPVAIVTLRGSLAALDTRHGLEAVAMAPQ